jgi:hypothetical protein
MLIETLGAFPSHLELFNSSVLFVVFPSPISSKVFWKFLNGI